MTSENVIIKEFETMKTFQEENIERLTKMFNYNKLEEIKKIIIGNIEEIINDNNNSQLGSWLKDIIVLR